MGEKKGFFKRLVEGLTKTRNNIVSGIDSIFSGFSAIDEDFYEEIEEILIMGDLGINATTAIIEDLKQKVKEQHIKEPSACKQLLIDSIKAQMNVGETAYEFENRQSVVLVIGVNGVGKTTSIGKLAGKLKDQGKKVILAAADTFRAAAGEQLTEWAHRAGVEEGEYDKLDGSVELKDVTFGYSKLSDPLIEHFNLSVQPGQRVAIVGASGCGKSTISKLICGLYQPWEGEILFGGKKASEIHHQVFTGSLAVVDQDIILFEDTIANNIKMWDSTIEDYEMILAARDAQLHEDIMNRDGGYQYRILDGGRDFSGGQRQRLEIARVLAQDPTIILMDEATSALDAKTEYDVVNSIKARGITCIVVAHRLSTIQDCDEIIVMDKGKIAERGRHAELMEAGGLYTKLVLSE